MKQNPLVWVIDHNEVDLLVASRMIALCEPSFLCVGFKNANAALQQLLKLPTQKTAVPDIILLETSMPLTSGVEFTEACFQINWVSNAVPKLLVLSSEIPTPKYKQLLENKKLCGYLEKPIAVKSLCLNLRNLLN
jgi:CheY-like chemotaxis protein